MDMQKFFHHPDISMPVVRRRSARRFLEFVEFFGEALLTRGRSLDWNHSFPSKAAFRGAVRRLEQAGLLVAHRSERGELPAIELTDVGRQSVSELFDPARFWNRRWNKIWYILMYDVPESDRGYRNVLRGFLSRLRMGCLQRSVWVSPRDIRSEYEDLMEAAVADSVSFLFESRTVLGRGPDDIVSGAWDWARLASIQNWYLEVVSEIVDQLQADAFSPDELPGLADQGIDAYLSAMAEDPLLPRILLPDGYLGEDVYGLHRRLVREIAARL